MKRTALELARSVGATNAMKGLANGAKPFSLRSKVEASASLLLTQMTDNLVAKYFNKLSRALIVAGKCYGRPFTRLVSRRAFSFAKLARERRVRKFAFGAVALLKRLPCVCSLYQFGKRNTAVYQWRPWGGTQCHIFSRRPWL